MENNVTYTTSELPVAAYLKMRGIKMISASKGATGKFQFVFDDSDSRCDDLLLEFLSGEFSTFDAHLKSLKKMIYSKKN
jgi:hypothetical protein